MSGALLIWWALLCAAAAVNMIAWAWSACRLAGNPQALPPEIYATRRKLMWLSAVYVLGCAFRSILPMVDVPHICLHDTWAGRVFIGRSVATVAELCFAAQWALLLREAGTYAGGFVTFAARRILPLIVLAEIFSWFAVLKGNYLLHAIENSLWALAAVLAVAAIASARSRFDGPARGTIGAALLFGIAYVVFMTAIDVPMYWARWQADLAAGNGAVTLREGLAQVMQHCTVTLDWAAWREDVPWLTLYFTLAVWISIAIPHSPPLCDVAQRKAH